MPYQDDLDIVQLTLIRQLTPKEAVEWIKQHFPEAHIKKTRYYELLSELNRRSPKKLFDNAKNFTRHYVDVQETISDLQKKSYEDLDKAIDADDYKTAQFIINSIRDLQIWRLNILENTKAVIQVHAKPEHSPTEDQSTSSTAQSK